MTWQPLGEAGWPSSLIESRGDLLVNAALRSAQALGQALHLSQLAHCTCSPLKYEDTVVYRYLPLLEVFFWIEVRIKAKLIRVVLDLVTGR